MLGGGGPVDFDAASVQIELAAAVQRAPPRRLPCVAASAMHDLHGLLSVASTNTVRSRAHVSARALLCFCAPINALLITTCMGM